MSVKDSLLCLYSRTIPSRWTNSTNWGSEISLSRWHGVQVDIAGHVISINLNNNKLEGTLPDDVPHLRYLQHLQELALSSNLIHGSIGSFIRHLSSLTSLNLSWNKIEGEIPIEFSNLKQLVVLRLDNNQMTGEIPGYLKTFSLLRHINLSNNNFTGLVPAGLEELQFLQIIDFSGNKLEGFVPKSVADIQGRNKHSYVTLYDTSAALSASSNSLLEGRKDVEQFGDRMDEFKQEGDDHSVGSKISAYSETFCSDLVIEALKSATFSSTQNMKLQISSYSKAFCGDLVVANALFESAANKDHDFVTANNRL